jgi:hypothetical protein
VDTPRLDAGEIQQRVDQLLQPQRVAVNQLQTVALPAPLDIGERILDRAEYQSERRAELMADVGEEGGFRPVQLGESLGPAAFLLVGSRVGDSSADVPGDEIEEAAVVGIDHAPGAKAGHEEASRPSLAGRGDGQDQSGPGRFGPGAARQLAQVRREIHHQLGHRCLSHAPKRPRPRPVACLLHVDPLGRRVAPRLHAGRGHQAGLPAVGVE